MRMRRSALAAVLALAAFVSACAPKVAVVPPSGPPHYSEFIEPTVPAGLATEPIAQQQRRAWLFLQGGDLRAAEREAALALRAQPRFYPAETTMGYIALARQDVRGAVAQFTRVTDAQPDYVPALVGKGLALEAGDRPGEAVEAFRAAVKADPSLTDYARRIDVLTLRSQQEELTAARQAARGGQFDAAVRAYRSAIAASPDSAFLYRELAGVERQRGDTAAAIDDLTHANTLDPTDLGSFALLGDLLEEQGDADGALKAYQQALDIEADPAVEAKVSALRARQDLARLPEQYRAIETNAQLTRADLAALVGVRFPALLQAAPVRDIGVITDVRGNWAERWIAPVARAGVVEAFANHTFQPRAVVRRVDFAQAVARLLDLVATGNPARARAWAGARGRFSDLPPSHLAYNDVSAAVAAGVLQVSDGAFQPSRVVSGADAIAALDRLRALAGAGAATQASDRR
jgi:tetratricopeptide (TPR) repeat protein